MAKRMTLMLVVVAVFLTVVGSLKYRQIQAAIAQGASFQPPPEAVTTVIARQEVWPDRLGAIGTVVAVQGVTVSADLPGIVQEIAFESGRRVRQGDVLVQLDTRQEQAQLAAARAQLELGRLSLERARQLRASGAVPQAEYDAAVAAHEEAQGRVGEVEAAVARKTIRAPFAGLLGIRQVNLGQYLTSGDPVVPLQSLHPIYVDFAVPQQHVGALRPGTRVQVSAEGMAGDGVTGRVEALNSVVDEATRNIHVRAVLDNPESRLLPGMFVHVELDLGDGRPVVALPASAISYAPYGDSVFIVEEIAGPDGKTYRGVRQQFVKLGGARGDQVAVLDGVASGQEVVSSGAFKLRNGAAVLVNNAVQPANEAAPRPEDG
ncbi:MAG: efflux RND transporter periplasmic adaptor subunit [Candidatus Latescibacterota bacterium]